MDSANNGAPRRRNQLVIVHIGGESSTSDEAMSSNTSPSENPPQINKGVANAVPTSLSPPPSAGSGEANQSALAQDGSQGTSSDDIPIWRGMNKAKPQRCIERDNKKPTKKGSESITTVQDSGRTPSPSSSSSGGSDVTVKLFPKTNAKRNVPSTARSSEVVETDVKTEIISETEEAATNIARTEDRSLPQSKAIKKPTARPPAVASPKRMARRTASAVVKPIRKRNYDQFNAAILRTHRDFFRGYTTVSKGALLVMNDLVKDILNRLALEARQLMKSAGKRKMTARDIEYAVRMCLPENLARHAMLWGNNALRTYAQNLNK